MKSILTEIPPLPQANLHSIDASTIGIGGYLGQGLIEDMQVLQFVSRTLKEAERKYSTSEKECLAIVYSTGKFAPFLKRRHFTAYSDHHCLKWLNEQKQWNSRILRWSLSSK